MKDCCNDMIKLLESVDEKEMLQTMNEYKMQIELWRNIPIKLLELYGEIYNFFEYTNRQKILERIKKNMEDIVASEEYGVYETKMNQVYDDIKNHAIKAYTYGIINQEEKKSLLNWIIKEKEELILIRKEPIYNSKYLILEFSYHNHYMKGNNVHSTGLTNDILINKILDKLYEDDVNCAQIIRSELEEKGRYENVVASILSDGTIVNLIMLFEDVFGSGMVRFVRTGAKVQDEICFNLQDGFDVTTETEQKDEIIERCMQELFAIMKIVENL